MLSFWLDVGVLGEKWIMEGKVRFYIVGRDRLVCEGIVDEGVC
jgi:hypothetical protein